MSSSLGGMGNEGTVTTPAVDVSRNSTSGSGTTTPSASTTTPNNTVNNISKKSRLPSRRTLIFGGVLVGLAAYKAYDYWCCEEERKAFLAEDGPLFASRNAPLPSAGATVPPLIILTESTHWARYWYKSYVKDLLDASGTDARVVEVDIEGVGTWMQAWFAYQEKRASLHQKASSELIEDVSRYNGTWASWWFGRRSVEEEASPFHTSQGLVLMGDELWSRAWKYGHHAIQPLSNSGADPLATKSVPVNETPNPLVPDPQIYMTKYDGDADAAQAIAKVIEKMLLEQEEFKKRQKDPADIPVEGESAIAPPTFPYKQTLISSSVGLSIPGWPGYAPIGFISATNQSGFSRFPQRIWGWLNERNIVQRCGTDVSRIVRGATQPMSKTVLQQALASFLPASDLNNEVSSEESPVKAISVTSPPPLAEQLRLIVD